MTRLHLSASLFALAVAAPAIARASAQSAAAAASNVDVVVVTATRTPTEKLKVASSVTVITDKDIAARQSQTLSDVLADAPGLNLVQAGGPGGLTQIYIRGTNNNHVKVLVDGIDVSDPSGLNGGFDFGQFLAADIERVEILRGPQGGLYGGDAIGGVINIITKRGEGAPHLTASLEGGTFATFNQNATLSGSAGRFHYALAAEHLRSGATPVTPRRFLEPGEPLNDDSYDNTTASAKLGFDVTRNFDLSLVARYTDAHLRATGDDDFDFGFPDPVQSKSHFEQYFTRATGHLSLFDGRFDQTFGLAYSNEQTTDTTPGAFGGVSPFFGDRVKFDWQGEVKLTPTETLVLGAEHTGDEISKPIAAYMITSSGYTELQSNPLPNLNGTLSVRYDAYSRFGGEATYRFAPTYFVAATNTKLEASVGTGFKAPSLSEMFQDFPAFAFFGNPDLSPEKSVGYDIGFEQYLLDRRVQFGATYFYNRITNLISIAGDTKDGVPIETYKNIGRAHTDGVESFIEIQPVSTVNLRLDYTYTDARDEVAQDTLPRRPMDKWSLDARWQATPQLSFDANLLSLSGWVDGDRDFSVPRLDAKGYTTMDLAGSYDLTRQLTVYGRVSNLFDRRYQDPFGFQRPSRGFFVGVKARL